MNDMQRRKLTEFLCECWHEYPKGGPSICIKCDDFKAGGNNRTFTTWQDLGDVKDKLVEKGLWDSFYDYGTDVYEESHLKIECTTDTGDLSRWLFRTVNKKGEPHFCRLVAEFKPWENEAGI